MATLRVGQALAHYTIAAKLGSGGMGEVYLASDQKLDRQVALKILPPEVAEDIDRRSRFTREAKAVAALNHPNIVTVYSVEDAGGVHFITMELVKGQTLADHVSRGGVTLGQFFEIAIPLTDAIAAAHLQGITHRDLEPANVMVGADGRVKVLDFGLAKTGPVRSAVASVGPTQSATDPGRIVGTPAYMSPEQAEGKAVDTRADIFALGILFYELLAGERPFKGDNAVSLASSILKDTPRHLSEIKPAVPRELGRLVQ